METGEQQRTAAYYAVDRYVHSDMALAVGSGATMRYAMERLAERIQSHALHNISCVPICKEVANTARHLGVPLATLEHVGHLDLYLESPAEIDSHLNMNLGVSAEMIRHKIVATMAHQTLAIVDENRQVVELGMSAPVLVEVLEWGWITHMEYLSSLGCNVSLLRSSNGTPAITESGNFLCSCTFPQGISAITAIHIDDKLTRRSGILEHSLVRNYGYKHRAIVATQDRDVKDLKFEVD